MRLGIFAKTFARSSPEGAFDALAGYGLHETQFNMSVAGLPSMPDEIDPALADRVREAAAERNIALVAVSGTFNMIHPDVEVRRDGLRRLGVLAGACERLGTSTVTLCTGTRDPEDMWRRHPDNARPEAWRDLLATMQEALETAEEHGVTLAFEPEIGQRRGFGREGEATPGRDALAAPQGGHGRSEPLRRRRPRPPALTLGGDPGRGLRASSAGTSSWPTPRT